MKSLLIFLIATIPFSISSYGQMRYWEDLSCEQRSEILEACKSVSMKRFYKGKFVPTDDDKTWELLNELVASSDTSFPLSFYLFNKICSKSDGALAEMVGEFCVEFIAKHPKDLLTYFSKEMTLKVSDPLWKKYALSAGYELYFEKEGTSDLKYDYQSLRNTLVSASKGNKENEVTFKFFWQLVDETIKNMD